MPSALKSLCLILSTALLLVACSQTSLAYRNLDWLIPWRVSSYLDLDSQQKAWLEPRIQTHLNWHCSSELPRYVNWLKNTRPLLQSAAPDAQQLDEQLIQAEQAFQAIVEQTNPTAVQLLSTLSDAQVERLYARMDKDNREDREEFLEPDLQIQIVERAERLEKRLRPWFGPLNDKQREHVATWASDRREQSRLWLEGRERWQAAFRETLDRRRAADFSQRMTQLLENRRGAHDPEAAQAYLESRQAMASLFSQLLADADDKQRTHLLQKIDALRLDLAEQICAA